MTLASAKFFAQISVCTKNGLWGFDEFLHVLFAPDSWLVFVAFLVLWTRGCNKTYCQWTRSYGENPNRDRGPKPLINFYNHWTHFEALVLGYHLLHDCIEKKAKDSHTMMLNVQSILHIAYCILCNLKKQQNTRKKRIRYLKN